MRNLKWKMGERLLHLSVGRIKEKFLTECSFASWKYFLCEWNFCVNILYHKKMENKISFIKVWGKNTVSDLVMIHVNSVKF